MTSLKLTAIAKNPLLAAAASLALVAGCKTAPPQMAASSTPSVAVSKEPGICVIEAPGGVCKITIVTTNATDMSDWARQKLAPVLAEWYPRLCAMLPSPGYTPPTNFIVIIAPGDGVAATGGTRVTANADWMRKELDKQAIGALLHEEVHVVQQYGYARRNGVQGNFSYGDITNLPALAQRIKEKADSMSVFIGDQLTPSEQKALADYHGPGPKAFALRTNLVAALNRVISGPQLYEDLYKGFTLRESTTNLLADKQTGSDLKRLNRSLIEDVYAGDLTRRSGGGGRRGGGGPDTGWLTEGIPDYIRWFLYEPQSHGASAEYIQGRIASDAKKGKVYEPKYDEKYRISANFLNYVSKKYDSEIVAKVNSALRQGKYYDDFWLDATGKTVGQLNDEWTANLHAEIKKLKPKVAAAPAKS